MNTKIRGFLASTLIISFGVCASAPVPTFALRAGLEGTVEEDVASQMKSTTGLEEAPRQVTIEAFLQYYVDTWVHDRERSLVISSANIAIEKGAEHVMIEVPAIDAPMPRLFSGPAEVTIYVDNDEEVRTVVRMIAGPDSGWADYKESVVIFHVMKYPGKRGTISRPAIGIRSRENGSYSSIPTIIYENLNDLTDLTTGHLVYALSVNKFLNGKVIPIVSFTPYSTVSGRSYHAIFEKYV